MSGAEPRGYLALLLHAHLPYVRHPEHEHFLEEEWLFEAISETYLPLIDLFQRLASEGVRYRLTLVLSPSLISMLDDPLLRARYRRHVDGLSRLIDAELKRTREDGHLHYLASHYAASLAAIRATYRRVEGDIVSAFGELASQGHLELITCAATHGYLPLMQAHPAAVWAQLKIACDHFRARLGQPPVGIWLPECGYYRGLESLLARAGLRYFVADTHGLLLGEPRPKNATFAPVFVGESGVAAFARDPASASEVWSREHGYPGDYQYREFYRDIGYDLDLAALAPFLGPGGVRRNTGIKYHRITGPGQDKALYDPYWARRRAETHAHDFVEKRRAQIQGASGQRVGPPLVVAPYDAELFGHWWYEGPWWLEAALRDLAGVAGGDLRTIALRDYLERHSVHQRQQPAQSSWGEHGFHQYWLNPRTEWIYPKLHLAAARMAALADAHRDAGGLLRRALDQAARELLLAQSSDWAFIMRSETAVDYAVRRTRSHLGRFAKLCQQIRAGAVDARWLAAVESLDNIFSELEPSRPYQSDDAGPNP